MSGPPRLRWAARLVGLLSAIGNHEFCPWANRYVQWLKQPIGWFAVAAVAAGLTGALVAPQTWVVCAVILVVIVLGTAWPWLAMRGLAATIEFNRRRCHELDAVTVSLTVTNRWPWPVWGLLVERGFFHRADQQGATTALARVAGWSKSRFSFTYHPPRRGIFPHEQPLLATGFPFGLWIASRPIHVVGRLTAWPRSVQLRSLPMVRGDRLAATGSFVDRPGHDGDILAARPYVQGDSLRRVHWVHTARRDMLIVCERQTASRGSMRVALDRRAFCSGAESDEAAWDCSLRVVASLCREFHAHACELTCELNGERHLVQQGTAGLHRLLDRLAAFRPEDPADGAAQRLTANLHDPPTILVTSAARWRSLETRVDRPRQKPRVRAVVIDDGSAMLSPGVERREGQPSASRAWIALTLAGEPARQLQQQWERQCHADWAT